MTEPAREPETGADDPDVSGWPASLGGVTETVVTTRGPNDRWNAAALGVFDGTPATATTWGNTRTKRNFHRTGEGYVQFVDDPVDFARAAVTIDERDDPVLPTAAAWARVRVRSVETGSDAGTDWERWQLEPVESAVRRRTVPTIGRGFGAVVEATVAVSRLGVDGYDDSRLRDRLAYFDSVVERAGDTRDREAMELVRRHASW